MKRYLENSLLEDLESKFVLVSGPRQVGKTTLSQSLADSFEYLNHDSIIDRKKMNKREWDRTKKLIIFDEVHKMKNWKSWLKGIYDTERKTNVIVTGSARIDTHKKVGDSMAGRYFQYHLMPLDLKELKNNGFHQSDENLEKLLLLSGFPEPFLKGKESFYKKWRKTHLDIIIKQDLVELESIKRIADIETLVDMLTERVGSTLSYNSLREDLQTDDKSVKRWCMMLENTYAVFKITPYSKNVKNSLSKLPKYYFYDFPRVSNQGARLENLVALSLYKEILFRNDSLGEDYSLNYLRNRQHQEVDFIVSKSKKPIVLVEVKSSDSRPSADLKHFGSELKKQNPKLRLVQLVKNLDKNFSTPDGVEVEKLSSWLEQMPF